MAEKLLGWMFKGLIRWLGWPAILSLTLLALALGSVVWGLAGVVRGLGLVFLLALTGGGLLLGWVLAAAKPAPGWLAGLVAAAIGGELVILRVGRLGDPLAETGRALTGLAWQVGRWPLNGPPNTGPLLLALDRLWPALATLWSRWLNWALSLAAGTPAFDPVAVSLVWSMALWAVAVWAAWGVRRWQNPLLAITPAAALLATTLAYTLKQVDAILPVVGAALMLTGLTAHTRRERRWQATGTDFAPAIRADLAMAVVSISLGLVVLAGAAPSISVRQIARYMQQRFQARAVTGSLGLTQNPAAGDALGQIRAPGLPRGHLLGSGPELSEQVALVVRPIDPPVNPDIRPAPRYYWRSLTYDRYTGRGWVTGKTQLLNYAADEPAITPNAAGRVLVRQQIQTVGNQAGLLYAAGDLLAANQPYQIYWRNPGDPFAATIAANAYQVDSLAPAAGEVELESSGSAYPDWVLRRYLYLPDSVPERVLVLARDLTATEPTPYHRARAIEQYLRAYPYSLDLPEPPVKRDMVDYFLFDLRRGYCDYYATAMVVLARAAGLPARLAVGYISNGYNAASARYLVTEAEAHSWPEIYFPGYGWVNFEPTGGRPALERPARAEPRPAGYPVLPRQTPRRSLGGWWPVLPAGLAVLLLLGAGWAAADSWYLRNLPPRRAIARLYRRLGQHARRLGVTPPAGHTPYEFAAALAGHLSGLKGSPRFRHLLAPAALEIRQLTGLYVQTLYSTRPPDDAARQQAVKNWRHLRRRLWLAWLWQWSKRRGLRATPYRNKRYDG